MNIENNNCIFRTLVPFSFASSHIAQVVTVVTRAVTTLLQSSFQVQIGESCSVTLMSVSYSFVQRRLFDS